MGNDPPLTLYSHPLSSYGWKVLLALYETETAFQSVLVEGQPKAHPILSGFWPIGKVPVLHDAARGQAIPESSIIIEYSQQYYPSALRLIPDEPAARLETRLRDRFFDLYIQNSIQKCVTDRLRPAAARDPAGVADAHAMFDTAYAILEDWLQAREWVAGSGFSMADCAAFPALFYAQAVHPYAQTHPAIAAYVERMAERPAARRIIRDAQTYFRLFPFVEGLDPRFLDAAF